MGKLILVRHGKSLWNVKNVFTGWTDVDLAPEGMEEAKKAGELIKSNLIEIDICCSSYLKKSHPYRLDYIGNGRNDACRHQV
ncbi:histidine phosphatase family protein [Zobellia nedashkovskayae]